MPINISDWSATPASNTSIDGGSIAENTTTPGHVNNALRAIMAGVRTFYGSFSTYMLTIIGSADAAAFRTAIGAPSVADLGTGVPTGAVVFLSYNSVPTGFLKANGAAVSRTTYSALFAAIGTIYGSGDGSSTFNLPDIRGEFVRGWDDGRGVDAGRAIGTAQADDFEAHTHGVAEGIVSGGSGSTYTSGDDLTNSVAGYSTSQSTGGAETRPRNISLLALIKT